MRAMTYSFSSTASETALLPVLQETEDQNRKRKEVAFGWGVYLAWEPRNVPTRYPSVVLDHNLNVLEFGDGDRIECHIEEDERPFEERVDGIC